MSKFHDRTPRHSTIGCPTRHLGIDNRLFVDPNLLKTTECPELADAREDLQSYFTPIITLLKASKHKDDVAWVEAVKRLMIKEEHGTALGYSSAGETGQGRWPRNGRNSSYPGREIVSPISKPRKFEVIGLFQENFGPDLLSDMAVGILKERFLAYTPGFTKEQRIKIWQFRSGSIRPVQNTKNFRSASFCHATVRPINRRCLFSERHPYPISKYDRR